MVLAILWCYSLSGQTEYPLLWELEGDVNMDLGKGLHLNTGMAYRDQLVRDVGQTPLAPDTRHVQASVNGTAELGFYDKIGAGIMYRLNSVGRRGVANELRSSEQYSHGKKYNALRLVHRLQLDQRFWNDRPTEFRFRYRLSVDLPLNGLRLDPGEYYLVVSAESLLNNSKGLKPAWDQRITAGLGKQLLRSLKFQLDLEFRAEDYTASSLRRLFLATTLIYAL